MPRRSIDGGQSTGLGSKLSSRLSVASSGLRASVPSHPSHSRHILRLPLAAPADSGWVLKPSKLTSHHSGTRGQTERVLSIETRSSHFPGDRGCVTRAERRDVTRMGDVTQANAASSVESAVDAGKDEQTRALQTAVREGSRLVVPPEQHPLSRLSLLRNMSLWE